MERLHPVESLAFAALLAAALFVFSKQVSRVAKLIRSARKDPGFSLSPLAPRIRDFVWEVLCQAKVIKERPLPGLAHAFLFWGFCAFGLVSLNHFALGAGFPLFDLHTGWFGPAYGLLAAAFAIAVAASIIGLAIRRLVVQPKWLGEVSYESGFIALLILTLMMTYLFDFAGRPAGLAFHITWWLHTAALLTFLPLIPHTKH